MANLNPRQAWQKREAGRKPDPLKEFEVLDPHHKPDLNGELAGGKVYRRGQKEYVMLTEEQARFYLDSAAIKAVEPKAEGEQKAGPQQQKAEPQKAEPQRKAPLKPGEHQP